MDDYEILEDDLLLLENPLDFQKWLYSLHEEIDIYEVSGLIDFFLNKGWEAHVVVLNEFKKLINNE
jgi:hypothetical protein